MPARRTQDDPGLGQVGSGADAATRALDDAAALQAALATAPAARALRQARALLTTLRNQRAYPALLSLAEAVLRADPGDAASRCLYAQGLIETGSVLPALALLEPLGRTLPRSDAAWSEAWGLAGRCHKQIFFDAVRSSGGTRHPAARPALAAAVDAYARPYRADRRRHTWHGVNVLALASRARREGWDGVAPAVDVARLARQLLKDLQALPARTTSRDPWHLPTLAEVALGSTLATGALQPVQDVLAEYLNAPGLCAFQVQSTLRQFSDVWGLETLRVGMPGVAIASGVAMAALRRLVDLLRARLLQLPGGELRLTPGSMAQAGRAATAPTAPTARARRTRGRIQAPEPTTTGTASQADAVTPAADTPALLGQLEAVLGSDGPQTFAWWRAGVEAARSVAVVRQRLGRRLGSGFLVRAGDLGVAAQPDELLLLTNFHVVNPDGSAPGIRPADAEVVFEADDPGRAYAVAALVWSSPVAQHDAALLRLQGMPAGLRPLPLCPALPEIPPADARKRPRVYVVGYPGGRELSFSFQDNELLDHEGPPAGKPQNAQVCRVHYRAPTEGGSSGSPVFDDRQWQVLALHHMGGRFGMPRLNGVAGNYAANEGLAMGTLAAAVKAALGASA